jgi:hypothetical protein
MLADMGVMMMLLFTSFIETTCEFLNNFSLSRFIVSPSACFRKVVHRVSLGHIPFWLAWLAFHLFVCFGSHMHLAGDFAGMISNAFQM